MMKFLTLFMFMISFAAFGGEPAATYDAIDGGTLITISSYDGKTRTFKVNIEHEATGPNYTTLEFLRKAIDTLKNDKRVLQSPASLVGNQYTLDRDLVLYTDEAMDRIRKKRKLSR